MSRFSPVVRSGSDRTTLYQEITARIIAELAAGRLPWVQPWGTSAMPAPLAMPRNASTGRCYSGINVLILWGAVAQHGFSGQSWLTFRQALALGGHVGRGARGTSVVFADRFIPDAERERARERGDDPRTVPFLKRFTVFNTDQCEGLPEAVTAAAPPAPEGLILPAVEALIRASGADLRIGGGRAYYDVIGDFVQATTSCSRPCRSAPSCSPAPASSTTSPTKQESSASRCSITASEAGRKPRPRIRSSSRSFKKGMSSLATRQPALLTTAQTYVCGENHVSDHE